jgi:hypothetical protein
MSSSSLSPPGGFAHVYLASSATPIPTGSPNATTKHVLKRIAVPTLNDVTEVGKEVEVMVRSLPHTTSETVLIERMG